MAKTKVTGGLITDASITSAKIAANTITTNQLHSTFTLDGVAEGASELYYTVARANTAIDARVNKTFIDALNVDSDTLDGHSSLYFANTTSPGFTSPTAATAANNVNSTQIATTAFVRNTLGDFTGNIIPSANVTYDLGTATMRWRDLYLSGATIDLGGTKMQLDANSDVQFLDASNNLKRIRVDEIELGSGSDKLILKRGSDGKLEKRNKNVSNVLTDTGISLTSNDTDDLSEGSTNLYYTDARADARTQGKHLIPTANNTYTLGNSSMQWHSLYVGPGSLYIAGKKVIECRVR